MEWIDRNLAQIQNRPKTGKKSYGPPLIERLEEKPEAMPDKPTKKSSRRKDLSAGEETADDPSGTEGAQKAGLGEKLPSYRQLPDSVRKSFPEIKVFMHFYSPDPGDRFVQVNEHTLHEGKSRPDGLKVLQITEHAAIFSYQGHRFQIRAVEK